MIAILTYSGVKGFLYFKYKERLDAAITNAAPFASIHYQGLGTALTGSLTIDGIMIKPAGMSDDISIDKLELQVSDLRYLLAGALGSRPDDIPEKIGMSFEGVRVSAYGEIATKLYEMHQAVAVADESPLPASCRIGGAFGPDDYRALDIRELVMDMDAQLQINQTDGYFGLDMGFKAPGMESGSLHLALHQSNPSARKPGVSLPKLAGFSVEYTLEHELIARAKSYCAEQSNMTVEQYIEAVVDESDDYYMQNIGIIPGEGLRTALKDFLDTPDSLYIGLQPASPLDLTTLGYYKMEDLPALLGLTVRMNDQEIQDLDFTIAETPASAGFGSGLLESLTGRSPSSSTEGTVPSPVLANKKPVPDNLQQKPRFHNVNRNRLKQYIGKEVRLHTYSGKTRAGILVEMDSGEVSVEQRRFGGKMMAHVPVMEITKAEVLLPGES